MKIKEHFEFEPQLFDEGGTAASGDGSDSVKGYSGDSYEHQDEASFEDTEIPEGEDAGNPDAEFDELVKGKYKDQYQKRVNSAINKRLKGSAKEQETGQKIMNAVAMRYGLTDTDPDKLLQALESDQNLVDDAAAKAGLTPTQYRRMMALEQDKAARERQDEATHKEQLRNQFTQKLEAEAAECKKIFPGFELGKEMQNKEFADMLRAGIDITRAYKTVHMDEIMSGGMKMAMQKGTERVTAAVRQNAKRASEGGAGSSPAVSMTKDYSKMTDEEFKKFREAIKNGEI